MITKFKEYKEIIAWLASQGHPGISESNLSRWRKGGYQDWIKEEQRKKLRDLRIILELFLETTAQLNLQPQKSPSTYQDHHHVLFRPSLRGGPESTLNN